MIVLVCGGRDYNDKARIWEVLDGILESSRGGVTIINGAARGADRWSTIWAREKGQKCVEFPIAKDPAQAAVIGARFDWVTHGKIAGHLRNQFMLDESHPDLGIVFPGGNGTQDMLCRLFRAGVETRVVKP